MVKNSYITCVQLRWFGGTWLHDLQSVDINHCNLCYITLLTSSVVDDCYNSIVDLLETLEKAQHQLVINSTISL